MDCDYLFVYGTLLSNSKHPMGSYLRDNAELLGNGYMLGLLYEVDGYPGAVESTHPDNKVFGEVYKLKQPELLLSIMDEYEECTTAFSNPHEYVRKVLTITLLAGTQINAWIYVFNRDTKLLALLPSGRFLSTDCDLAEVKTKNTECSRRL